MTGREARETAWRLDLRGLDPPGQLRQALEAVEMLGAAGVLEIITDLEPTLHHREREHHDQVLVSAPPSHERTTSIRRNFP